MAVLTVVSCLQIFFRMVHHAQGFGGRQTLLVRNVFVGRNLILRSMNDGFFDDKDRLESTDQVTSSQESDSSWFLGSEATIEKSSLLGAKNILQQLQETAPILSSSTQFSVSTRMEEIEALGGDPFFLDTDTDSHEIVPVEPQDDIVPNKENLQFGMLMDLAFTGSSKVLSRIDGPTSSRPNTRDNPARMRVPLQEWEDRDNGMSKKVATKDMEEIDEILALGGDPFFLVESNEDPTNKEGDAMTDKLFSTNDDSTFRIQKNDQRDAIDRTTGTLFDMKKEREEELSPMDILSQLSSFSLAHEDAAGTMSTLQRLESTTTNPNKGNEWTMNDDSNLLDEIEAMGGDASFLDIPPLSQLALDEASNKMNMLLGLESLASLNGDDKSAIDNDASLLDEIEAMGGDPSFLDLPNPLRFARDEAFKRMSIQQQLGSITNLDRDDELAMDDDANSVDGIEAMGGDPFFLNARNPSNLDAMEASKTPSIFQRLGSITGLDGREKLAIDDVPNMLDEIEEMGGDPSFLDIPGPSYLVRDEASETMIMLQRHGSTKILNRGETSNDANMLDEIEEMGGDPSFLDIPTIQSKSILHGHLETRMCFRSLCNPW